MYAKNLNADQTNIYNVSKCKIKIQKYKSMLLPQKNRNKKLKKGNFKEPPSPLSSLHAKVTCSGFDNPPRTGAETGQI